MTEARQLKATRAPYPQRFYEALVENALDVIAVLGADGRILYQSPSTERVLGRRPEEMIGRNVAELIHPDDIGEVRAAVGRTAAGGIESATLRIRHADGSWRTWRSVGRKLPDDAGIDGIVVNSRDITDVQAANDALRESEARFRGAFATSGHGMALIGLDGHFMDVNEHWARIVGYSPEELLRRDFQSITHPDDLAADLAELKRLRDGESLSYEIEKRYLHRDGHEVWIQLNVAAVRSGDGTPLYLVAHIRDFTERKRQAEATREALCRTQTQLEAVGRIAQAEAVFEGDVEAVARDITETGAKTVGCERVNAWLFNADETELTCIDAYQASTGEHSAGMVLKEAQFRNEFEVLKSSTYVDADDALTDPRTAGYVESYLKPLGIASMLDAVIKVSDRHLGLLCFEHVGKRHRWRQDEIAFACQLADKIGLAAVNRQRGLAEEELRWSETGLAQAQAIAGLGNWDYDPETGKGTWSAEMFHLLGLDRDAEVPSFEQFLGLLHPEDLPTVRANFASLLAGHGGGALDFRSDPAHGPVRHFQSRSTVEPGDGDGRAQKLCGTLLDITEGKQAERALKDSEARFRDLVESTSDMLWAIDEEKKFTYVSPKSRDILGYPPEEMVGRDAFHFMPPEERERVAATSAPALAKHLPLVGLENTLLHKDGHRVVLETSGVPIFDAEGTFRGYRGVDRDITDRKRAEQAAQDATASLRLTLEASEIGLWNWEPQTDKLVFSPEARRLLGYDEGELPDSYEAWTSRLHPDDLEWALAASKALRDSPEPSFQFEYRMRHKDGHYLWLLARGHLYPATQVRPAQVLGSWIDITERKRTEAEIHRLNRVLRIISACNTALVREAEEGSLLATICRLIVEDGTYRLAMVSYAEDDGAKNVAKMRVEGPGAAYADGLEISWGDAVSGSGPTGHAIRSGRPSIVRSFADDPICSPWAARAAAHGLASMAAFPLADVGRVFGALDVYSETADAFDDDETRLLNELANDLAFGITAARDRNRRAEAETRQGELERQTERALMQAIESISLAVEARDPYTAGHEREVSRLAHAIAREMGLPESDCEGIRVAGLLHDIGKLKVPMEILARPARLTAIEYEMVKTHVEMGYEILAGIAFPWPVADMVLQHHERLDGSGYPKGLKGDEVLLGARILAVADTIQAMGSHRPYRSARGIDAALLHVLQERGRLYDAAVVDACLALFNQNRFHLDLE